MSKVRFYITLSSLILIISTGSILLSLPSSSFLIVPWGINESAYKSIRSIYTIECSDEDFTLIGTANQQILSTSLSEGKTVIKIASGDTPPPEVKDLSVYLKNTPYLNLDNKSIKKTALDFNKSRDPVREISIFVYKHISDKKLGIPLLPAASILNGKAGDCTEHSILTVSLLRANKIPARAVMGMILSENFAGKNNVFVYHMWVEAYKNGRWILVDSTRPYDFNPNRYIALAYHNLMTEMPSDYLRVISAMQDIKITYSN